MSSITDIGTLIDHHLGIHGGSDRKIPRNTWGRPIIAGTGTSVRRIAVLYKQRLNAEEIAYRMPHLTLAQVYAALAYYHANRDQIEADLAAEEAEYWRLAALHGKKARIQQ